MNKAMSLFHKGALVASICAYAGGAQAQEVNIQERIEYYDISGKTAEQLLKSMNENSPMTAYTGVKHFAVAESYFKWSYSLDLADGQCGIESYNISVDMLYIMPRWIDQERGRKRLVEYWADFEQKLWIHERGHGDIALATGIELAKAVGKTTPAENCDVMRDNIDREAKRVLKEREGKQKEYDKATKHGMLQGAYFDVGAATRRR